MERTTQRFACVARHTIHGIARTVGLGSVLTLPAIMSFFFNNQIGVSTSCSVPLPLHCGKES